MRDINFRIKELVEKFSNGNNSNFAVLVDSSEANIRNYINGTQPKVEFLETICAKLEINAEWLLTGKGTFSKIESKKKEDPEFEELPLNKQMNSLFTLLTKQSEKIDRLENFVQVILDEIEDKKN